MLQLFGIQINIKLYYALAANKYNKFHTLILMMQRQAYKYAYIPQSVDIAFSTDVLS